MNTQNVENQLIKAGKTNYTYTEIRLIHKELNRGRKTSTEWWAFLDTIEDNIETKKLVRKVVSDSIDASYRLRDFKNSDYFRNKIRAFCNERIGTDVNPYEVVNVISHRIIEVRKMKHKAVRLPKGFIVGGFSAHCTDNYSQEYSYSSDKENPIIRITLTKKGWGKGRFHMSEGPSYFYDYNF